MGDSPLTTAQRLYKQDLKKNLAAVDSSDSESDAVEDNKIKQKLLNMHEA